MTTFGAWRSLLGRRPDDLEQPVSKGGDPQPAGGLPAESTFRDVLGALRKKDPERWGPPTEYIEESDPLPPFRPHLDYSTYVAASLVFVLSVAGGAMLIGDLRATSNTARNRSAEPVSTRLEQIAAAIRAPVLQYVAEANPLKPASASDHLAVVVADNGAVAVQSGGRAPLTVHIENVEALEPETSVLVHNLPIEARLSEGIMISPGVWMMRAGLLGTVEVDTGAAPAGRHTLLVELRRPEGSLVSSARVVLSVATPPVQQQETLPQLQQDSVQSKAPSPISVQRIKRASSGKPVKREKPVTVTRTASPKPEPHKPARKAKLQSEVTVLAAPAPIVRPGQSPKLVWPGDDPRATYSTNPPVFLGGSVPNNGPVSQPTPGEDWHKRIFENTSRAR